MSEYRKEANQVAKNSTWTFFRFLPLFLIFIVVMFFIGSMTKWGGTVVERKVFENSYQRSEGIKSGIAMFKAQQAEINSRLTQSNLSDMDKQDLLAKKSALAIQISTLEAKAQ
jgi:hypothetical protein